MPDLTWLAGLLEGEGTFMAGPPSSPRCPVVRVEMTDRDVVVRVAALIDRTVSSPNPRKGNKRSYITAIKGRPAIALMLQVAPMLSEARRRQIRRALRPTGPRRLSHAERPHTIRWLAGLLEGEGSFVAKRGGTWLTIAIEMCDRPTISAAATMLGASSVTRRRDPRHDRWTPTYRAAVVGNRAIPWMRELRPMMGQRRRRAIDRALASWTPIRLWPAPANCTVSGCSRPHRGRGLCHAHYMRWSRYRAAGKDPGFQPLR